MFCGTTRKALAGSSQVRQKRGQRSRALSSGSVDIGLDPGARRTWVYGNRIRRRLRGTAGSDRPWPGTDFPDNITALTSTGSVCRPWPGFLGKKGISISTTRIFSTAITIQPDKYNRKSLSILTPTGSWIWCFIIPFFTHMTLDTIVRNLKEAARCLKPDGRIWASFFILDELYDPDFPGLEWRFDSPYDRGLTANAANPEKCVRFFPRRS